jgi:hypothetical protein
VVSFFSLFLQVIREQVLFVNFYFFIFLFLFFIYFIIFYYVFVFYRYYYFIILASINHREVGRILLGVSHFTAITLRASLSSTKSLTFESKVSRNFLVVCLVFEKKKKTTTRNRKLFSCV